MQSKGILALSFSFVAELKVLVLAPPWHQIGVAQHQQLLDLSLPSQLLGLCLHEQLPGPLLPWQLFGLRLHQQLLDLFFLLCSRLTIHCPGS